MTALRLGTIALINELIRIVWGDDNRPDQASPSPDKYRFAENSISHAQRVPWVQP